MTHKITQIAAMTGPRGSIETETETETGTGTGTKQRRAVATGGHGGGEEFRLFITSRRAQQQPAACAHRPTHRPHRASRSTGGRGLIAPTGAVDRMILLLVVAGGHLFLTATCQQPLPTVIVRGFLVSNGSRRHLWLASSPGDPPADRVARDKTSGPPRNRPRPSRAHYGPAGLGSNPADNRPYRSRTPSVSYSGQIVSFPSSLSSQRSLGAR